MAISFNGISQYLAPWKPTFDPQNLTVTGNGRAINLGPVGPNIINAVLLLGDAVGFTSLAVKIQAAQDDGTGNPDNATWVDVLGLNGSVVAFTTATTDLGTSGAVPEVIEFKLPQAATVSSKPYIFARAVATLTGTSILMACWFIAARRYDGSAANVGTPGNAGNQIVN